MKKTKEKQNQELVSENQSNSDRGIMQDDVTLKIPGSRLSGKTRSVLLVGGVALIGGLIFYKFYRRFKDKSDIKAMKAKNGLELAHYREKKRVDLEFKEKSGNISNPTLHVKESKVETNLPMIKQTFKEAIQKARENGEPKEIFPGIFANDRAVIVGASGSGKTLLSNQIGFKIGSGQPCGLFPNEKVSIPQRVLLIDTEQEEDDMYIRYGNMNISDTLSNITRISDCQFNSSEEVVSVIREEVKSWNENGTVIIDNITSCFSLQSAENIRKFYGELRNIQNSFKAHGKQLSYIILTHETKNATKLSLKSIQGSGNIGNFATTVFALGQSALGENLKYLKVLKARRGPKPGNVYLLKLEKEPYLHLEYQRDISEEEALSKSSVVIDDNGNKKPTTLPSMAHKLTEEQIKEIKKLYAEGQNVYSLSLSYGVNRNTIRKYLSM